MTLTPAELKRIRREQGINANTMARRLGLAKAHYVQSGELVKRQHPSALDRRTLLAVS